MPVRRKITALAVGTLALSGGVPVGASAAEPGFTVDPQSPAGVEYQIPLENARGQGGGSHGGGSHGGGSLGGASGGGGGSNGGGGAAGGGSGGSGASTSSPSLFGAGITPATRSGASNGAPGSAGSGSASGGGSASQASGGSRHLPTALTASADYSSTGPIAGIVAAILIAGAAFGLFLRQRARRPKKIFS
jgi:hypothetical protein